MDSSLRPQHAVRGSLGRSAEELLAQYARSHRDRRNIQTHLLGVPLGVLALAVFLRGPQASFQTGPVTPAWAVFGLLCAWYLTRGHWRLGTAACGSVGALVFAAHQLPASGMAPWLFWSAGLLLFGLLWQAVGHYYEGQRPASWKSPVHLLVGPMFVTAYALSAIGFLRSVVADVERRVGPVHVRDLAHPVPQR
jgi:uncharacterized membrane protein YGL010W